MKRVLFVAVFFILVTSVSVWAQPTVQSGYTIELVASGASAADGIAIFGGYIYVADYAAGALRRVAVGTTGGTFETVTTGLSYPTAVAVTDDGRIFVTASATGDLCEVVGSTWTVFATGFLTATSIKVIEGDLFITNSDPGTITRTSLTGTTTILLAGLTYPYGLSTDGGGLIYFLEHSYGNIYESTVAGAMPELLAVGTPWGVVFTTVQPSRQKNLRARKDTVLFVSDVLANVIWKLEAGEMTVFANNFAGKGTYPFYGPTGLAFDSKGVLYVADAANLWRITPTRHHPKVR